MDTKRKYKNIMGSFQELILLSIHVKGTAVLSEIIKVMSTASGKDIHPGATYLSVQRLIKAKYITISRRKKSQPNRKFYKLTKKGLEAIIKSKAIRDNIREVVKV